MYTQGIVEFIDCLPASLRMAVSPNDFLNGEEPAAYELDNVSEQSCVRAKSL